MKRFYISCDFQTESLKLDYVSWSETKTKLINNKQTYLCKIPGSWFTFNFKTTKKVIMIKGIFVISISYKN